MSEPASHVTLALDGLAAGYGGMQVIHEVDLEVQRGSCTAIIGPNGAGKSSCLRAISGVLNVHHGSIRHDGTVLNGMKPWDIVERGLIHVPEDRGLFLSMTVRENLLLGRRPSKSKTGQGASRSQDQSLALAYEYFPKLAQLQRRPVGLLSGGEQQMVAIGRGLIAEPDVLMLDEPSLGLAPRIIDDIFDVLARMIADEALTVVLVEQNAELAMRLASKVYVLEAGHVLFDGAPDSLRANAQLRDLYLGMAAE